MTKYKVVLQYVGTRYSGWQIQKNQHTIQGNLKSALHQLTGEEISVVGAGRTDSGVHAMEQVAHLRLSEEMATEKLFRGLNGILPWDHEYRSGSPGLSRSEGRLKETLRISHLYRACSPSFSPWLRPSHDPPFECSRHAEGSGPVVPVSRLQRLRGRFDKGEKHRSYRFSLSNSRAGMSPHLSDRGRWIFTSYGA